ncbi:MAG: neuraminidase-like domain-containing protein [Balneolaceae bacterium]
MNKKQFLQLEKLATLTPSEIQKKNPAIYKELSENAGLSLKTSVERKIKDAPKEVKDMVKKVDFSPAKIGKLDAKTVLAKDLLKGNLTKKKKKELEESTKKIPDLGKIDDFLQPDIPVAMNPAFRKNVMKAKLFRLSDIAGITAKKTEKVLEKELVPDNISGEMLQDLVKDRVLNEKEAKELGLTSNLHTFLDSSFELAEHVKKAAKPNRMSDLVKLDRTDWQKIVKGAKVKLPKGMKQNEYANLLYKKVEKLFPETSLVNRLTRIKLNDVSKSVETVQPLLKLNETTFGNTSFDDLIKDDISENNQKKIQTHYQELIKLSRLHPGLNLDTVLNDKQISPADKGKIITECIHLLDKFHKNNRDINFLTLSYRHDSDDISKLNFQGVRAEEKEMLLKSVKAYQRVYSFTNDIEHTEAIMSAGFHSSFHIASVTLKDFAKQTDLSMDIATTYFENAHMGMIKTAGMMGSILDVINGGFDWMNVGNMGTDISNYLRKIPGYEDLFGEMAFCDCEHCKSIYSPAAYFVDLMQFIERHVIIEHFSGSKSDHVLNLEVRRPDLWTLPLSCENTNKLVPYLDIINEILESYIANQKGFSGDLSDRAAVSEFVYKREIALEKPGNWKNSIFSFNQPYHHPLKSVSAYLKHFEKTRAGIAQLLNRPEPETAKARLNLSDKEYHLITASDSGSTFINRIYGTSFTESSGKIVKFDAQLLLKPMGVDRKELGRLFKTKFITSDGADNIQIRGEKTSSDSVQNDIERVRNLTYAALDRSHRFVRLWRKTGWAIEELDMILAILKDMGIATEMNEDAITAIGDLLNLQEALSVSVEELCGIVHQIPVMAAGESKDSLLDKLFNHDDVVLAEGNYPKPSVKLIHSSLVIDKSTPSSEYSASRLMMGLNRSDDEIMELIRFLAEPLGIVALDAASEADRGFNLTIANISLLYRHSKIAENLKLSISELFRMVKFIPSADGYLQNREHIKALMIFNGWFKKSSFSLDELNFIIQSGDLLNPDSFGSPEGIAAEVIVQTHAEKALLFADTIFTSAESVTESQSRAILEANDTLFEYILEEDLYRLSTAYDPNTPLTVPSGITVPEPELREILNAFHPQYLLPHYLAAQTTFTEDSLSIVIEALGLDLNDDEYLDELQNGGGGSTTKISELAEKVLPLSELFKDKKYTRGVLLYVIDNPDLFGISDWDTLAIGNVHTLHQFLQHVTLDEEKESNIDDLSGLLDSYSGANGYQSADIEVLADLLETKQDLLSGIHPLIVSGGSGAIETLSLYKKLADLCGYMGVGGDTLSNIVSTNYDDLQEATQAILAAFRNKYPNEDDRKEKLEPYQDALRGKKRRSLTNYLIFSDFPQFTNENDLFHYFLIDTELEGCARTSRLVAATMSLQLYVHRILMNFEQDDKEPGTAGRVHVPAEDIPEDEWSWRKNYRVWEANRKVFLYPENYIEPDLRDNKTPLFKELENELLQREINADHVMEAYARYMRGFDEVSHLKIAGSYHEKDDKSKTDVLHLFGVSADNPPVYYYRRVENIHYSEKRNDRGVVWGPWQKINVQIPVRHVAPIIYNGRLHIFWVNITSLSESVFENSRSLFTGYSHKMSIQFSTLSLDGSWTPPQKLNLKNCYPFEGNGAILDPLVDEHEIEDFRSQLPSILQNPPFFNMVSLSHPPLRTPRYDTRIHWKAEDEYTLEGFMWDRVYPKVDSDGRLILTGAGYQMRAAIDFYNLNIQNSAGRIGNVSPDPVRESLHIEKNKPGKIVSRSGNRLYQTNSPSVQWFDNYAYGSLIVNTTRSNGILDKHWNDAILDNTFDSIYTQRIASLGMGSTVQIINGAYSDAIIDVQGDLLLLQGSPVDGNGFLLKRIGTTLSETLTRTLFTSGVDATLDIETQKQLEEESAPISIVANRIQSDVVSGKIDFKGAYGTYYREIFFHIPFLIANHLNSQGKYADAQKWYHYIFNPTANEVIEFPSSATAEQKKKMEMDRNWRYLEFREQDIQKLRDQLNDKTAIETYKKDPFNPHAIARLRLSAYQKTIVMKYIDNLLDWGDQLFARDTMESINEATMLYITAKEILGKKPSMIGDCGESVSEDQNYNTIQPLLDKGSEFLAELESYSFVRTPSVMTSFTAAINTDNYIESDTIRAVSEEAISNSVYSTHYAYNAMGLNIMEYDNMLHLKDKYLPEVTVKGVKDNVTGAFAKGTIRGLDWIKDSIYVKNKYLLPSFGWSIIKHVSPVFCVPGNKDLLEYYDRVEDRLYKIRNCMNIEGIRRQLALFAPEIDPAMLVRAKAAGLSMDDILNATSGNLPPYRFTYILEKAKAFTSVVQGYGSTLLSAIERKSGEELALLRLSQQQNILAMTSKSRKLEIDSANEGIKALNDRVASLNYQIGYYESLIAERTSGWEIAQQAGVHTSSIINGVAIPLWNLNGVFGLIPQIGSPFAMKYGGQELSESVKGFAEAMRSTAIFADNLAKSAGLEAGFDRRSSGWKHQKTLLEMELKQVEKNLIATEIKRDILIEAEEIHKRNIDHNQEVIDFYGEKFTSLGLYTWLSTTLQKVYKEAFNNAMAIARLAEQAYRYERDDNTFFIDGSYFESSRGGLLAGERLLMSLQTMERRYLETNYRKNEIDQAFSLTQINPAALLNLKQTGECSFEIPEIFFDLFYPGQYRRKIQAVRLTIPSVTGPYTNVSATLSLLGSKIRLEPKTGSGELKSVPMSRTTTIATSTAQNDAGVFQLNFRDERYMPFEGSGANSSWNLSLPKNFRQFDYNTINDVIIHISYTAEYDGLYRENVEKSNGEIEDLLTSNDAPLKRMISLRQEFSTDFHRLLNQPADTAVSVNIENRHFPLFMNGKDIAITKAVLILVTADDQSVSGLRIGVNSLSVDGFTRDAAFGSYFTKDLGSLFSGGILQDHQLKIENAGDLAVENPEPGNMAAVDMEKLDDIVMYLEYKIG